MRELSPWRMQHPPEEAEAEYSYHPAESEGPHLRQYWKVLLKHRRLIVPIFLVMFGLGTRLFYTYLTDFLVVTRVKHPPLDQVMFTTPSPRLSQQLANAHVAAFIRTTLETRFELSQEAREFLQKKLAELKAKTQRAEDTLQRFRQAHGVVSLEPNENIVIERMVDLNK